MCSIWRKHGVRFWNGYTKSPEFTSLLSKRTVIDNFLNDSWIFFAMIEGQPFVTVIWLELSSYIKGRSGMLLAVTIHFCVINFSCVSLLLWGKHLFTILQSNLSCVSWAQKRLVLRKFGLELVFSLLKLDIIFHWLLHFVKIKHIVKTMVSPFSKKKLKSKFKCNRIRQSSFLSIFQIFIAFSNVRIAAIEKF